MAKLFCAAKKTFRGNLCPDMLIFKLKYSCDCFFVFLQLPFTYRICCAMIFEEGNRTREDCRRTEGRERLYC